MFPLQEKTRLMRKTAEALTDPDFNALTSLEDNGGFITLQANIRHANTPMVVSLQLRSRSINEWNYRLVQNDTDYDGRLDLGLFSSDVLARQFLDRVGKRKVQSVAGPEDSFRAVYKQGKGSKLPPGFYNNGKFIPFEEQEVRNLRYWVPTVACRFSMNANNFLTGLKSQGDGGLVDALGNSYGLGILRDSPTPHFRSPFERTIHGDGGEVFDVSVSGTYVNTNWEGYSTDDIQNSLRQHAGEIAPLHFARVLLPAIVNAGHDAKAVGGAYYDNRDGVLSR